MKKRLISQNFLALIILTNILYGILESVTYVAMRFKGSAYLINCRFMRILSLTYFP